MDKKTESEPAVSHTRYGSQQSTPQSRELAERALASTGKGIIVEFPSKKDAERARLNIIKLRSIDRKQSVKIFQPNDPMYGKSNYDSLILKVKTDSEEITTPVGEKDSILHHRLYIYKDIGDLPMVGVTVTEIE